MIACIMQPSAPPGRLLGVKIAGKHESAWEQVNQELCARRGGEAAVEGLFWGPLSCTGGGPSRHWWVPGGTGGQSPAVEHL